MGAVQDSIGRSLKALKLFEKKRWETNKKRYLPFATGDRRRLVQGLHSLKPALVYANKELH